MPPSKRSRPEKTVPRPLQQATVPPPPRTHRNIEPVVLPPRRSSSYEDLMRKIQLRKFESRDRRLQEFLNHKKKLNDRRKMENERRRQQFLENRERIRREEAQRLLGKERGRREERKFERFRSNLTPTNRHIPSNRGRERSGHFGGDYSLDFKNLSYDLRKGKKGKPPHFLRSQSTISLYGNQQSKKCQQNADMEALKFRLHIPLQKMQKSLRRVRPEIQPFYGGSFPRGMFGRKELKMKPSGLSHKKRRQSKLEMQHIFEASSLNLTQPSYDGPTAVSILRQVELEADRRHAKRKGASFKLSSSRLYAPSKLPVRHIRSKGSTRNKCDHCQRYELVRVSSSALEEVSSSPTYHCVRVPSKKKPEAEKQNWKTTSPKLPTKTSKATEGGENQKCKSDEMDAKMANLSVTCVSSSTTLLPSAKDSKNSTKSVSCSRKTQSSGDNSDNNEDGNPVINVTLTPEAFQSNSIGRTPTPLRVHSNSPGTEEKLEENDEYSDTFLCEEASLTQITNYENESPRSLIGFSDNILEAAGTTDGAGEVDILNVAERDCPPHDPSITYTTCDCNPCIPQCSIGADTSQSIGFTMPYGYVASLGEERKFSMIGTPTSFVKMNENPIRPVHTPGVIPMNFHGEEYIVMSHRPECLYVSGNDQGTSGIYAATVGSSCYPTYCLPQCGGISTLVVDPDEEVIVLPELRGHYTGLEESLVTEITEVEEFYCFEPSIEQCMPVTEIIEITSDVIVPESMPDHRQCFVEKVLIKKSDNREQSSKRDTPEDCANIRQVSCVPNNDSMKSHCPDELSNRKGTFESTSPDHGKLKDVKEGNDRSDKRCKKDCGCKYGKQPPKPQKEHPPKLHSNPHSDESTSITVETYFILKGERSTSNRVEDSERLDTQVVKETDIQTAQQDTAQEEPDPTSRIPNSNWLLLPHSDHSEIVSSDQILAPIGTESTEGSSRSPRDIKEPKKDGESKGSVHFERKKCHEFSVPFKIAGIDHINFRICCGCLQTFPCFRRNKETNSPREPVQERFYNDRKGSYDRNLFVKVLPGKCTDSNSPKSADCADLGHSTHRFRDKPQREYPRKSRERKRNRKTQTGSELLKIPPRSRSRKSSRSEPSESDSKEGCKCFRWKYKEKDRHKSRKGGNDSSRLRKKPRDKSKAYSSRRAKSGPKHKKKFASEYSDDSSFDFPRRSSRDKTQGGVDSREQEIEADKPEKVLINSNCGLKLAYVMKDKKDVLNLIPQNAITTILKCAANDPHCSKRRNRLRAFRRDYKSEFRRIHAPHIRSYRLPLPILKPVNYKNEDYIDCSQSENGIESFASYPDDGNYTVVSQQFDETIQSGATSHSPVVEATRPNKRTMIRKRSRSSPGKRGKTPKRRHKATKSHKTRTQPKKNKRKDPEAESSFFQTLLERTDFSLQSLYRKASTYSDLDTCKTLLEKIRQRFPHIVTSTSTSKSSGTLDILFPDSTTLVQTTLVRTTESRNIPEEVNSPSTGSHRERPTKDCCLQGELSDEHSGHLGTDFYSQNLDPRYDAYHFECTHCGNQFMDGNEGHSRGRRLTAGGGSLIPSSLVAVLEKIYEKFGGDHVWNFCNVRELFEVVENREIRQRAGGSTVPIYQFNHVQTLIRSLAVLNHLRETVDVVAHEVKSEAGQNLNIQHYLTYKIGNLVKAVLEVNATTLCNLIEDWMSMRQGIYPFKTEDEFEDQIYQCVQKLKTTIHSKPTSKPSVDLPESMHSALDELLEDVQEFLLSKLDELCDSVNFKPLTRFQQTPTNNGESLWIKEIIEYFENANLDQKDENVQQQLDDCPLDIMILSNNLARHLLDEFLN
ncbi:unnamed protein product [Hermetia illucens]|uniref:Uncharacterized protein n=2 Tax=Hermetia illucens TaxID=343691 RepID=A0A7R8YYN5_HERIL|nr:unnamed protein product [Hermetia illucens]